jgi:DNA-binding GntR family transcriptional regulator
MDKSPHYRIVYEALRSQINSGVYKEGDLIPSENEICASYGVTRPTVRQALDKLVNEGLILKHHGKGSIVQAPKTGLGILSIEGTTSAAGNIDLKTKILSGPELRPWDEEFMFTLTDEERAAGSIRMERQRFVENHVVLFEITYMANINLPSFTLKNLENKSLFDTLRKDYAIEATGGDQKIWSIPADKNISEKLSINLNAPVLHLKRRILTNRIGFYIYSSLYCNTTQYFLQGTF